MALFNSLNLLQKEVSLMKGEIICLSVSRRISTKNAVRNYTGLEKWYFVDLCVLLPVEKRY